MSEFIIPCKECKQRDKPCMSCYKGTPYYYCPEFRQFWQNVDERVNPRREIEEEFCEWIDEKDYFVATCTGAIERDTTLEKCPYCKKKIKIKKEE